MNPFKSTLLHLATKGKDVEEACWLHMEDDEAQISSTAVVDLVRESQASLSQKDALHITVRLLPLPQLFRVQQDTQRQWLRRPVPSSMAVVACCSTRSVV